MRKNSRNSQDDASGAARTGSHVRTDRPSKSPLPEASPRSSKSDDRFHTHMLTVLSVSSGMVGVCLTAIGLIGIARSLNRLESVADDLLAISSLAFMLAAFLSFLGMRTRLGNSGRWFALALDLLFCGGLVLVVLATILLTWVVL